MTTATREGPIPFTGDMVRAILEGRKTQTRRVAKLTPSGHVKETRGHRRWHPGDPEAAMACPYGQPVDRLWVRETWSTHRSYDHLPPRDVPQDAPIWYAELGDGGVSAGRPRPGMFMVRWMSRVTLSITSSRVERLHAITEADARAEGVEPQLLSDTDGPLGRERQWHTAVGVFRELWDSINAKRGHGWDTNLWVWVVEFEAVTP